MSLSKKKLQELKIARSPLRKRRIATFHLLKKSLFLVIKINKHGEEELKERMTSTTKNGKEKKQYENFHFCSNNKQKNSL